MACITLERMVLKEVKHNGRWLPGQLSETLSKSKITKRSGNSAQAKILAGESERVRMRASERARAGGS